MEHDTIITRLEMVYPDGRKMLVGLDHTQWNIAHFVDTKDCYWWAENSEHPELGIEHGEWVVYLTAGGAYSKSKTQCSWDGLEDGIVVEFEHRDFISDQKDEDKSNKRRLLFRDWNGDSWEAHTPVVKVSPSHPTFRVRRI